MYKNIRMERNLTTGSVLGNVIYFSLPYLLSYIGQFEGVASTTAVSIGSQVMHMLTVMIVGLAMGSTVSIGQAIGGNDKRKASLDIGNTVTLFMMLSVALTLILLILADSIVSVMSTPEEAVAGTLDYLTVCFIGIPFITAYNIISSIFRGMGDSRSPMYFIAVACVSNIILDYIFMGALHMGPVGAALGTTLSQAVSVVIALIVIRRKNSGIKLEKSDFRPNGIVMKDILGIGVPIALQDGFIQVSFILITIIANRRGLNDAAAVGIVEKIISFLFLIPSSMLSTVSALGAQNIGAHKNERARQTLYYAALIASLFGLAVSIIMQFAADSVVSLFTDASDPEGAMVIQLGGQYMRGYVWDTLFAGIHFSFSGYFCAIGKSLLSFLHNIIAIVLVRIPGAYMASLMFPDTLFPMGLATTAGSFLSVIICVIAFMILLRKERKNTTY